MANKYFGTDGIRGRANTKITPDLALRVGQAAGLVFLRGEHRHRVLIGKDTRLSGYMQKRLDYLDYVAAEPRPGIVVIEDLDGEHVGYGAFWGEVQSNIHKALGCLGTITNGSIRDIPMIPAGFQMLAGSVSPSHAYVHVADYGVPVNIHGMAVASGDLIHADRHGAVIVPAGKIAAMRPALDQISAHEKRIIDAARASNGNVETIKAALRG